MAQHDYEIANAAAASVRADINNALAAIVSQNSGTSAPSTTFAYQLWADTATGVLKIRNAANSGWITVGTLADTNLGLLALSGGTMTGALLANASGSAATPSLAPDSADPDTGLYGKTANQLGVSAGGSEVGYFSSAGWTGPVVATSLNGAYFGLRNILLNARFFVNQRGYVSATNTTTANQYTLDRWRVVISGQNVSYSDSGETRTVTAPAGGIEQTVEGYNIRGGTYTLNWSGTATATVDGSSVSKGGQVTLTNGTNAVVKFSGGTVITPQLEPGSVATPPELLPYELDLIACRRYCEYVDITARYSSEVAGGTVSAAANFTVPKRITPTITVIGGAPSNVTGITYPATTLNVQVLATVVSSGGVTLNAGLLANSDY